MGKSVRNALFSLRIFVLCALAAIAPVQAQIVQFSGAAIPSTAGTPALIQMVSSSANSPNGINGNNFKFTLPNTTLTNNLLTLDILYPHGGTITITDSSGDTWPAAAATADAGVGNYIAAAFVLPNATAAVHTITVGIGSSTKPFQYTIAEWTNLATSSPVNGTKTATSVSAPNLAAGSYTPTTNNDANGGNLIHTYFAIANIANGTTNPTNFTPGGAGVLLDGDIAWVGRNGVPHSSQYTIQTAQAAINPATTAASDTNTYNVVSIALKASNAGTPKPGGIHVDKVLHFTNDAPPGSLPLKIPNTGNLLVMVTSQAQTWNTVSGISDSASQSWTNLTTSSGDCQIFYAKNLTANTTLTVTLTMGSTNTFSPHFFVISGANANPYDSTAGVATAAAGLNSASVWNNAPNFTPSTQPQLVIAVGGLGQGPGLGFNTGAPSGAVFDPVNYTGETDFDEMDNADLLGHVYVSSTTALNWNWTITNIGTNSGFASSLAFK